MKRIGSLKPLLRDIPESYYWIGYILADGCIDYNVGRVSVCCAEKDYSHLKKLSGFLGTKIKPIPNSANRVVFGKYLLT